jgi:hypothetical protein
VFTVTLQSQEKKKGVLNLSYFDEKPLHFGFLIGFNTMDFRVHNNGLPTKVDGEIYHADVLHLKPGLNIGIVSSLRLNQNFNLRFLPGISFGQRDLYYMNSDGEFEQNPLQIKSTFLEFPLLVKFNGARMQNAKPYVVAGINTRYDLAKNKQDGLLLKSLDGYWEAGAGMDFYLTYFRLSVELKASIGLSNILNTDGTGEPDDEVYTEVLDALKSRIFALTFYFE